MKTQTPEQPIGIIESLSSGFDLVSRHLELLILPILLDVFLWLGPKLSAFPLFKAVFDLMQATPPSPGTTRMPDEMFQALQQTAQGFNLFTWLSPWPLGIPSLTTGEAGFRWLDFWLLGVSGLATGKAGFQSPAGQSVVYTVSNTIEYAGLFVLLNLLGLGLAAAYWALVASRVNRQPFSLAQVARLWWGLIKIVLLLVVLFIVVLFPALMLTAAIMMINEMIGTFLFVLGLSVLMWILFYLLFTVHGVALRGQPVMRSVQVSAILVRFQLLPTMALTILCFALYVGLLRLWMAPPWDSWLKAAGILGHAFIATGLVVATSLFYLDRIALLERVSQQVSGRRV